MTQRSFYERSPYTNEIYTQKVLQIDVLSAHRNFNTEQLVHTEAFTQKSLYTEKFFTQELLHKNTFTQESFYTQKLSHTEALYTEKSLHRGAFAHRILYTQTLSHTQEVLQTDNFTAHRFFTQSSFYAAKLVHTGGFFTQKLLHKVFPHLPGEGC